MVEDHVNAIAPCRNHERLVRLAEEKALQKLEGDQLKALQAACATLDPEKVYLDRTVFSKALRAALKPLAFKLGAPQLKSVMAALSERDPEAEVCTDKDGNPEPDTNLRDNENVPLGESIYEYFDREVKPHVPDAWIDESKRDLLDGEIGIVGFEIPFNRHFYKFVPPRPLEEIDADLKACTDRIKAMIEELSA